MGQTCEGADRPHQRAAVPIGPSDRAVPFPPRIDPDRFGGALATWVAGIPPLAVLMHPRAIAEHPGSGGRGCGSWTDRERDQDGMDTHGIGMGTDTDRSLVIALAIVLRVRRYLFPFR